MRLLAAGRLCSFTEKEKTRKLSIVIVFVYGSMPQHRFFTYLYLEAMRPLREFWYARERVLVMSKKYTGNDIDMRP